MAEQIIHRLLLALHNIALVGCAAAPFYNGKLVTTRGQYGPKLHYELDKVVEETLQGNAPYCIAFITALWLTGILMPLNYYLFNGAFRELPTIAWTAIILKLVCVAAMMVIMGVIFLNLNPRLRVLFTKFSPTEAPDSSLVKEFFATRARRKRLCDICLYFAIGVLVFSAFIGFGT